MSQQLLSVDDNRVDGVGNTTQWSERSEATLQLAEQWRCHTSLAVEKLWPCHKTDLYAKLVKGKVVANSPSRTTQFRISESHRRSQLTPAQTNSHIVSTHNTDQYCVSINWTDWSDTRSDSGLVSSVWSFGSQSLIFQKTPTFGSLDPHASLPSLSNQEKRRHPHNVKRKRVWVKLLLITCSRSDSRQNRLSRLQHWASKAD